MSFITKRERVFRDYIEPVPVPARNEGKLKAYSSCTDARAWSHFLSDKTEHLIEIIKKNSDICKGKYIPCHVILEMLLAAKNAEIARLKRKISTLENMLASYDQLELTCEQKCEISTAHAIIKAANKSLETLPPLELDMSNYTEGIDSEAFQTGKSGGDDASVRFKGAEWNSTGISEKDIGDKDASLGMVDKGFGPLGFDPKLYDTVSAGMIAKVSKTSKMNQSDLAERCGCDVSTYARDNKLEELEETLISKDAKLNAMQNTIAVMENDVCEPYCIYAHIFTALEKIFGTLRQNEKYRLFLDLMSTGKDTRCLDIKGKILFKLKILEKFSIALISPCSERFKYDETCECYAAQVETSFSASAPELQLNQAADVIRTQLIANIMENKEMKEIVDYPQPTKTDERIYDVFVTDNNSIDTENLTRIKNLQIDYEDLMNTYEDIKHERDNLKSRVDKYEDLEKELEDCRSKLREYNTLYSEREYYRKRSEKLDDLREQFMVLTDETSNLELQLKAETEINHIKASTIDDLKTDNISLEKKISDLSIAFEKDKNALLCKLKEAECTVMCQEQQIRSLSSQIDKMFENDHEKQHENMFTSATIADEIEALKSQIKNLNDALYASEDEKQHLQEQFKDKLKLINDLKMDIEEWKSTCEKTLQRNDYLEKYTEGFREEISRMVEENRMLSQEIEEKNTAVANLINVINNKSQEVNRLMNEIELKGEENKELKKLLQATKDKYGHTVKELENVQKEAINSLQLAKQESKELLEKVKDYDELLQTKEDVAKTLAMETESRNELRNMLIDAIEANRKLQHDIDSQENNNSILLQEIQRLREVNNYAVDNINCLQNEKDKYKTSFDLIKKESEIMEDKIKDFEELKNELVSLKLSHERLLNEKKYLENELQVKAKELDELMHSISLTKSESEYLLEKLQQAEPLKDDMIRLSKDYQKLADEKQKLQKDFNDKSNELGGLLDTLSKLKTENDALLQKTQNADNLEHALAELQKAHNDLSNEKILLQKDFDNKTQEINNLDNILKIKIEENRDLLSRIKDMEKNQTENINILQEVNSSTRITLESLRRESEGLQNRLKNYEALLNEHEELKLLYSQLKNDKETLQKKYERALKDFEKNEEERNELQKQVQDITLHSHNLEKSLIESRQQLIECAIQSPYDNVVREIEHMKEEQSANNKKIKELLDKIDESDNIISNLNEDLLERDDKIAILQNHINALEDELQKLHQILEKVVQTGEEIKDNSFKKVDQTLNKMEAHHSKATHNMKMELARLNNERAKLEDELSLSKIKSEESFIDKHKYVSQIAHLQNEREIIVTDIKQLEIYCVENSNLTPSFCGVEEVLNSLDKIQKCIENRNSKIINLEQTLQKVQDSSQLLQSKADEAKKLVEKEKQKIISEKEEAIADKLKMESQLAKLKLKLEEQIAHDNKIIKDLQGEILNQKLIIDKLNESTNNYISRLEDELRVLQNVYETSIVNINEMQDKVKNLTDENIEKQRVLDKVNTELNEKSKDVANLQKTLDALKNKPMKDVKVQMGSSYKNKNVKSQTDELLTSHLDSELGIDEIKDDDNKLDIDTMNINRTIKNYTPDFKTKEVVKSLNEVQILTANLEPPLDIIKNNYVDYKKKKLKPTQLEQFSISNNTSDDYLNSEPVQNTNLIVNYERESDTQTGSSRILKTYVETTSTSLKNVPQTSSKYGQLTDVSLPNKNSDSNGESMEPQPGPSSDRDLFLIYHDSGSSHTDNKSLKQKNIKERQRPILVEAVTLKQDRDFKKSVPYVVRQEATVEEERQVKDDSKVSQLLDISMPRLPDEDTSLETITDLSRKNIQRRPKKSKIDEITDPSYVRSDESHKLSRVDADFLLFKNETDQAKSKSQKGTNFGLEYILDSIQHEIDPVNIHNVNKKLHKSLSDDLYQQYKESSEGDAPNRNPVLLNFSDNKTISMQSNSKWSDYSQTKSLEEKGVMVNIDATEYYENQIRHLSQQLENNEKDYKKKIEFIKAQYDNNIKGIINEHNQGVNSIQNLHEETLQDIIKIHENEVENLRTMSIDAMRKAERLERENRQLKIRVCDCGCNNAGLEEEPVKMSTPELRKRRSKLRGDTKMLTKTNIEAFNVKPKPRIHGGPCTCSLDVNVSDTIRNIFEQVDVEQRKLAENAYLKYIANKILNTNVEALDVNELSFLHLKVCRTWKVKLTKEEALQKRIDSLENELMNKHRCAQQHIADLDRQVAEEHRLLQEAREAVCRCSPARTESRTSTTLVRLDTPPNPPNTEILQPAFSGLMSMSDQSAGDLAYLSVSTSPMINKPKSKPESRATLVKLDAEERRLKRLTDEPPTRLRRRKSTDRSTRSLRK